MVFREQLVTGHYYHVINRGIDGRDLFLDKEDYKRFLESLEVFNTTNLTTIQLTRKRKSIDSGPTANQNNTDQPLVEILCFCLLPNHFHLLLKQVQDKGIAKFIQKVNTGYVCYFNLKYERQGALFQGKYKSVNIQNDTQFLHVSRYIHLNVLDLYKPKWREGALRDWGKFKSILENYPWSSYLIFLKKKPTNLCRPGLLGEFFQTTADYENFLKEWAERNLVDIKEFILE